MNVNVQTFATVLQKFIIEMEQIDKDTVWQPYEPQWWLEMMSVDRQCRISLKAIKNRYGIINES